MISVGPGAQVPASGDIAKPSVQRVLPASMATDAERRSTQNIPTQDPVSERARASLEATPPSGGSQIREEDPLIKRPMLALPDRALPDLPRPEPAGPLRTFAQVPTELMQELTRLRSAEVAASASGIPGRLDPTPMPAPDDAIGADRASAPGATGLRPDAEPNPYDR
jgi:hypothetical protein